MRAGRDQVINDRRQRWQEQIDLWKKSGLSKTAFCKREKISLSTFQYRLRMIANSGYKPDKPLCFYPVVRRPSVAKQDSISVYLQDDRYHLKLADGFSKPALTALLDVLEER